MERLRKVSTKEMDKHMRSRLTTQFLKKSEYMLQHTPVQEPHTYIVFFDGQLVFESYHITSLILSEKNL